MASINPVYTPTELEAFTQQDLSFDELKTIGDNCFKPWADALANGDKAKSTVLKWSRKAGYSELFETLKDSPLEIGVNAVQTVGQRGKKQVVHVFQHCHYEAVYTHGNSDKKSDAAEVKHLEKSAIIPTVEYMGAAISCLQSSDPAEIMVGVAAVTGRRCIEVGDIGFFMNEVNPDDSYLSDVDPLYVYRFKNPAKKRNTDLDIEELPQFSATTLVQAVDLLHAVKLLSNHPEVREYRKEAGTVEKKHGSKERREFFNDRWEHKLGAVVNDKFSFLPGKLNKTGQRQSATPKDLRPAFAQLSYIRDMPKDSQGQPIKGSEILFKGRILGHYIEGSKADETLKRLSSTLSYYGYRCDDKAAYPGPIFEKRVSIGCNESDREWVNTLCDAEGWNQTDAIRYLRSHYEATQAELTQLREDKRQLAKQVSKLEAQLSVADSGLTEKAQQQSEPPAPGEGASSIEKQLFAMQQQLNRLSQSQRQQDQAKPVGQPTTPTARVETKVSARRMNALRWLEMCVDAVKDWNLKANGDAWHMWALSPRLLKDISKVSQKITGEFWEENKAELEALNEQWGLGDQHNRRRGMKGGKASVDFMYLTRPEELK